MPPAAPVILWFRQDLRLADNPALTAALATEAAVLPVYILDDDSAGDWAMGGASRWWLDRSLSALETAIGHPILRLKGRASERLPELIRSTGAKAVFWNRCYEPWRVARDTTLKATLDAAGITVHSFKASVLLEPWEVATRAGTPFRVFTPFSKACLEKLPPPEPLPAPQQRNLTLAGHHSDPLDLLPTSPRWDLKFEAHWTPGEDGARARLSAFLETGLRHYAQGRDLPGQDIVSRLSPHLHFGEISPVTLWHAVTARAEAIEATQHAESYLRELLWREFCVHLLHTSPTLPEQPLNPAYERFPWRDDPQALRQWQQGKTGIPIVDAGMRQLWETGWMHNRVRMIVGSFLVKNLLLPWQSGQSWFWDCLVDADLASNAASWQWIAGCGADAAPYFRVFNPVLQGRKFDSDGHYVRRYVPELARLPDAWLHAPWEAPASALASFGVTLGSTYPRPIVDLATSRERALAAWKSLR